jgi:tRNA dimethylallyltransferase
LLIIVGPTASGKTALAIEMCRRINGEIVSADSMQIYRGCDIVTAKPSREEQTQARHHLLDICEPTERFSAAQWAAAARVAIDEIVAHGKQPILAGGTGFYLRALLEPDTLTIVAPDAQIRTQLESELALHGKEVLWSRLNEVNPKLAARLHPNDSYRVLRALEIALCGEQSTLETNSPLTSSETSGYAFLAFGVEWPRNVLYERIERRVDAMIADGAQQELVKLLQNGVPREAPALNGVGYKQMLPALDDPALWPQCVETWKRDTRRYAKRQLTWFRHQLPVHWLDGESASVTALADAVAEQWQEFKAETNTS